jgi:pantoate--beta-alanine ligase
VREADGLALSSRNRFLTEPERRIAPRLYRVLTRTAEAIASDRPAADLLQAADAALSGDGFGVDYLALVDGPTLEPIATARPDARLIAAARLGTVRLLDNVPVG